MQFPTGYFVCKVSLIFYVPYLVIIMFNIHLPNKKGVPYNVGRRCLAVARLPIILLEQATKSARRH